MRKASGFLSAVLGMAVLGMYASGCGGGGGGGADGETGGGSGGNGNTVTIKVYNYMGTGSTIFVAAQDGNGSFQKPQVATLSVSTHGNPTETYTFTVNDPDRKYGVIAVCAPASGIPEGRAVFLTLDESSKVIISCGTPPENETLSGNLTWKTPSSTGDEGASIMWGNRETYVFDFSDPSDSYSVSAHASPADLVVLYGTPTLSGVQPESVYVERSVPSGTLNLDFNDTAKFRTKDATTVTLDCPDSNFPATLTYRGTSLRFRTGGGTSVSLGGSTGFPADIEKVIPDVYIQGSDRFIYTFYAFDSATSTTKGSLLQVFRSSAADTTCPVLLSVPDPASFADSNSNGRVEVSFNTVSSLPPAFSETVSYSVLNYSDASWSWQFHFSSGYLSSATSFSWEFPDLSSLPGWDTNWTPHDNPSNGKGRFMYRALGSGTKGDFRDCYTYGTTACPDNFVAGYAFVNNP